MGNHISGSGSDDTERAATEVRARLTAIGIALDGSETVTDLVQIQDVVERFEEIVTRRGGDLMMDEGIRGAALKPDDRHFALPMRQPHQTVAAYVGRLERAIDDVRRHPPR